MNILILQASNWCKRIGIPMVDFLKGELKYAKFGTVIMNRVAYRHMRNQPFEYDYKLVRMRIDDEIVSPAFEEEYGQIDIERIENDLGIDTVWKSLIQTQRSLVYSPGKKQSYAWTKQVDDQTMLNIVKVNYVFVKRIFEEFDPEIIITPNYVSLFSNVMYYYAKRRGVRMLRLSSSKISGHYILSDDNKHRLGAVQKRYKNGRSSEKAKAFGRDYIKNFREDYVAPEGVSRNLRYKEDRILPFAAKAAAKCYKIPKRVYYFWKDSKAGIEQRVFRNSRNLPVHLRLKNELLKHIYVQRTLSLNYYTPKKDELYFFFPMNNIPEENIMHWATYYTNQLEFSRQVAMGLPGKYTLYVKEHPMMIGDRNPKFYKKMMGMANVKMISPVYPTYKLIKRRNCKGVINLAGTVGFEALLLGKPVINFGETFYPLIPQCFEISDVTKLSEVIKRIEKEDFGAEIYEEALILLVAALKEESIEASYVSAKSLGEKVDIDPIFNAFVEQIRRIEKTDGGREEKSSSDILKREI